MTVKMKQSLPPEIDTKLEGDKMHSGPGNGDGPGFLENDTPKHANRKTNGVSNYHSQGYPPYQGHSGYPSAYYGHGHPPHPPSAMISPGTNNRYNQGYHPHGGHPAHPSQRAHGYYHPASSGGPGYPHPPPTYGNPSSGNHMDHYNNSYPPPPPPPYGEMSGRYPPQQPSYGSNGRVPPSYLNNGSQEFSRAVSSSFSESNNKKSKRMQGAGPNPHNNMFENRDDDSIASDASWKQLNQVKSIDDDNNGRFGATTPVDRLCPTLSSDMSRSPSISAGRDKKSKQRVSSSSKLNNTMPLSSIPSMRDCEDGVGGSGENSNDLDLRLCSTNSSGLLFQDEGSYKRARDERNDTETQRGGSTSRRNNSRMGAPPSPPNLGELSVQEERDAPPSKRGKIGDERDIYSNLSMESFPPNNDRLPAFGHRKANSNLNLDEMNDNAVGGLDSNMPSWDITGQDSFGGGFSVTSNLSDGNQDVLGPSFSFSNDAEFPPSIPNQNSSNPMAHKDNSIEKSDSIGMNLNPSESIDLSQHGPASPTPRGGSYPPQAATWVTNTQSAGSFSMGSGPDHHGRPPHYPPIPRNNTSNSQHPVSSHYGSMPPPPYSDGRPPYQPRPGGPYGMPPRPQGYLPPSFRPPPAGMAGPSMPRNAPPPVYMMSSPPGAQGMGVNKSQSSVMSKGGNHNWTKADDAKLSEILKKFKNPKNWEAIAKEFGEGRTAKQCNERWIRYLKPGVRKGQWQDHEDAIVIEAVTTCKEQPFTRWSDLAQKLPGRVGKQIRDRWVNHLNPNINHMPFTKEDDMKLWDGHKQLGKRWVEISTKFFKSSRSENHIKNRWYSASFKKFVATEFGPDAYVPCDKKTSRKPKKGKK